MVYRFRTLSSISADPLNRLKQPGLHRTEPNTCSAVFWSQWPTAYSNFWYHTIGPETRGHITWIAVLNNGKMEYSAHVSIFIFRLWLSDSSVELCYHIVNAGCHVLFRLAIKYFQWLLLECIDIIKLQWLPGSVDVSGLCMLTGIWMLKFLCYSVM